MSRKRLLEVSLRHPALASPLDAWYRLTKRAHWSSLADVRGTFAAADIVGRHTVFNLKGNSFRIITEINYTTRRIFIRNVLTHAEYDRGDWKR